MFSARSVLNGAGVTKPDQRVSAPVKICFVVAVAENGVIGRGGDLPWKLSSDLKRFRQMTLGKPVIMGRKTFASIGKPLDGRTNIVISRGPAPNGQGAIWVRSIDDALSEGRKAATDCGSGEVMVIGGAEIYRLLLPVTDRVYLTRVHASPEGDTFFPELPDKEWQEVARDPLPKGDRDEFAATLITLERR